MNLTNKYIATSSYEEFSYGCKKYMPNLINKDIVTSSHEKFSYGRTKDAPVIFPLELQKEHGANCNILLIAAHINGDDTLPCMVLHCRSHLNIR